MTLNPANFTKTIDGKQVVLHHLSNSLMSCYITNYGARVVSLSVHDQDDQMVDVVLGFDTIDKYIHASEQYHGATVGRYANRLAGGKFRIGERSYTVMPNNGTNALHGGSNGFHKKVWDVLSVSKSEITFIYVSPDMEEGFPGELTVEVTYHLRGSDLEITYQASSTKDTIINLTHHSYFNLNGEGSGSILDHSLRITADYFTPVNENIIPTGKLDLVQGTPFDFHKKRIIGLSIDDQNQQLLLGNGYDHNFAINHYQVGELSFVAKAIGDRSRIAMEVWTTEPGVQLYTANHLTGEDVGKSGSTYGRREAFCLETQHFPDSPNQSQFPSTFLAKEHSFNSKTEYRFQITV